MTQYVEMKGTIDIGLGFAQFQIEEGLPMKNNLKALWEKTHVLAFGSVLSCAFAAASTFLN